MRASSFKHRNYFISIFIFTLVLLPMIFSSMLIAQETITGAFSMYDGATRIQTNQFTITNWNQSEEKMISATTDSLSGNAQATYDGAMIVNYRYKLGRKEITAERKDEWINFREDGMSGILSLESTAVFFEPTLCSHYALLLHLYDKTQKKDTISVVIPSQQEYIPVTIVPHGTNAFTLDGQSVTVTHYQFSIGRRDVAQVWVNGDSLLGIYLTAKEILLADARYENLPEQIKTIVKRALY